MQGYDTTGEDGSTDIGPAEIVHAIALADMAELETRLRLQVARESYELGHADGFREGYEHGARIREAEWPAVVRPLEAPTLAELERLRWGPGGRKRAGDPQPTDRAGLRLIRGGGAA